jgi:hypothetical protein
MNTRYPQDKWLHIFTDGSQIEGYIKFGAGIHCKLFSCYMPLGQHLTAFDGEIEAIRTTLRMLNFHHNKFERALSFPTQRLQYYLRHKKKLRYQQKPETART